MLTLIDNHIVPYRSAIDGYIIAEARKGLPEDECALLRNMFILSSRRKKKPNAFYGLDTIGIPAKI